MATMRAWVSGAIANDAGFEGFTRKKALTLGSSSFRSSSSVYCQVCRPPSIELWRMSTISRS